MKRLGIVIGIGALYFGLLFVGLIKYKLIQTPFSNVDLFWGVLWIGWVLLLFFGLLVPIGKYLKEQFNYHQMKQAKKLFDDGILTENEYQEKLTQLKQS